MTITIFTLWISILFLYCAMATWKLFEKAGRKTWEGFVPVYNIFIWLKIIKKPWWWAIILLIPGFSQILMFASMNVSMGRMYGKYGALDTIMQIFVPFIYFPMIAFGKEELVYQGDMDWNNKQRIEARSTSDQIVLALASFGIISLFVYFQKFTGGKDKAGQKTMVKEWGDSIVFALIAASLIRGYVLEAFTIPTPSMEKELLVGDFLFVNKLSYGTRVPFTPLSYPLVHNTIPFTYANSYSEAIKLPYYRLPGFGKVERNDIVVFNYPTGDTSVFGRSYGSEGAGGELQGHNYYQFVRQEAYLQSTKDRISPDVFLNNTERYESMGRKKILENNLLYDFSAGRNIQLQGHAHRPIDKKENYIKRCVAVADDTLEIRNGDLYINGKRSIVGEHVNFKHKVEFNRALGNLDFPKLKDKFGFNLGLYKDLTSLNEGSGNLPVGQKVCYVNMSVGLKDKLIQSLDAGELGDLRIVSVERKIDSTGDKINSYISFYPYHKSCLWTADNYGPIWMPKAGSSISMNEENWAMYKRCITTYENNNASFSNGKFILNGEEVSTYTFKQNYYYMVGDNRHNSADSRMWGFVPEDHVVGKGLIIWMSKDQELGWTNGGVRWNRIFKTL